MKAQSGGTVLEQLELGPMGNYVYLLGDAKSKACAVVDPAWDAAAIREAIADKGLELKALLITHNHPDHTNAIADLLDEDDVPVYVHKDDAFALAEFSENLKPVGGGDSLALGALEVSFLHTPGHTPGSQCFLFRDRLLTGDTLFIRGCGRVDLPGSDPEKMYHSLRRLAGLKDALWLFPGHNYSPEKSVTLSVERGQNPYLQASLACSPEEFRRLVGF